ncbi:hypothetical protein [Halogeometricum limi]|uniref:Uncharacterized protein n=1 Tax=Halogeometricum limi TaxID=555875 RepID=A0A1I6G2I0_9EURY|nr:hypothetical protein [Halogeometricum limi]SFR36388.1 hypothetical protein SAMN04488124_0763 [Halogeometricum limi]
MTLTHVRAADTDELRLTVGEPVELESLTEPLVPEKLSLEPFVETPDGVSVVERRPLDEDGTMGAVYTLSADAAVDGEIRVGFRDGATGAVDSEKTLRVVVE